MRNAAAHFDDDFDLVEPKRKAAARRPAQGKRGKKGKRFGLKIDMAKVARYAAIGMSATVALGIVVNALMMQKGRHPAPLFGKSIPLGEPAAPKPLPPPAPVRKAEVVTSKTAPSTTAEMETPVPPAKPSPEATPRETASSRPDPIARLLQDGAPPPAEKPDGKIVLGAQRALVKLGFVLKPNGNFGPQTKKALEMFEKDRHLPVKGELSRRILKILAAESGLKIEH